ncbi:TagK domain-containing protein [Paraburkholderia hayleyella]|uniref:TagK domain-containing protein n=1 Tax=Paraburkholderia hayleyella TaxID=2152889 RepID=UPI001290D49B|nr:TagK domain-containing protein [Paraburkholderia hayleyella]
MRSFRLPWHRQSSLSHTEPVLGGKKASHVGTAPEPELESERQITQAAGAAHVSDDILGAFGIGNLDCATTPGHGSAGSASSHAQDAANAPDALIATLHAQYWRALSAPNAPHDVAWVPAVDEMPQHRAGHNASDNTSHGLHSPSHDSTSIETLLSGAVTLEDAFGPLVDVCSGFAAGAGPAPEILRLFAPPEFHTAVARRTPAQAPTLTRREHHTLAVDSPLSAPLREDTKNENAPRKHHP